MVGRHSDWSVSCKSALFCLLALVSSLVYKLVLVMLWGGQLGASDLMAAILVEYHDSFVRVRVMQLVVHGSLRPLWESIWFSI